MSNKIRQPAAVVLTAALLSFSAAAVSAPFVVSDPLDPRATHCGIFLDAQAKQVIQVTPEGAGNVCKYDLQGISNGQHTIEMTAIANDPIWGSQESARSAPLTFVRPAAPAVPAGVRLSAQ